ncbi:DUF58 domain-containing protein [Rhodocytophaga rosea]|nr:DUF58 domain-containing protein [Rhodocytophaga rosea]
MSSLYLNNRFFVAVGILVFLCMLGFAYSIWFAIAQVALLVFMVLVAVDIFMLYRYKKGILGRRDTAEKLSNGDENPVSIHLENHYPFFVALRVIDELPVQLQIRNHDIRTSLPSNTAKTLTYQLHPVKRGEYSFGALNVFVSTIFGFAGRRYRFDQDKMVPVYPSYLQMRQFELMAISNRLTELGIKKIRKIGQNREFEQVKEYVSGDDIRTVNWKATARRNNLMVNHYQDEKSQAVYSVIDKGRVMKMPFEGMSLLDYAINASLVISNIAIIKEDKAGIITFSNKVGTILPASKVHSHMRSVLETLYNQKTGFKESNFDSLYIQIKRHVKGRSLILLYTNFETLAALERQLPYLQRIAYNHVLVIIFFENTELKDLLEKPATNTEEIYLKTIAEKFAFEKKQIVKELTRHGIHAVLTTPKNLTINTINKYLELKARGMI